MIDDNPSFEDNLDDEDDDEGCEYCEGMEEHLVQAAIEYKANGWDADDLLVGSSYGFTHECTECGRRFDLDPADAAYAAAPGPSGETQDP